MRTLRAPSLHLAYVEREIMKNGPEHKMTLPLQDPQHRASNIETEASQYRYHPRLVGSKAYPHGDQCSVYNGGTSSDSTVGGGGGAGSCTGTDGPAGVKRTPESA